MHGGGGFSGGHGGGFGGHHGGGFGGHHGHHGGVAGHHGHHHHGHHGADGSPAFLWTADGGRRGRARSGGGVPALVVLFLVLVAILVISLLA